MRGDDGLGPDAELTAVDVRSIVGWHVAFWVLLAIAVVSRLTESDDAGSGPGDTLLALGLLAALGLTFRLTVGGRRERVTGRPAVIYLVVAILVTGALCAIDSGLTLLLFIVYPQIWMYTETVAAGIGATVALTLSTLTGFFVHFGFSRDSLTEFGPELLASLLFSVALGVWISRVVQQSRQRAALIRELESTRAELAEAHHAQGVVAERERLAREIHDTLAQGFTSIVMLAQTARRNPETSVLETIEDVARENLAEARALVAAFTPVPLDDATVHEAIGRLGDRFARETGLPVRVEVQGDPVVLGRAAEVVLVRAAQEALSNVRRHARATRVVVRLSYSGDGAAIEVDDDGVGFDPDRGTAGFGLAGMRGRAADVGGAVEVASAPGRGTQVRVRVPAPVPGLPHAAAAAGGEDG